jgi:hypothetical protein
MRWRAALVTYEWPGTTVGLFEAPDRATADRLGRDLFKALDPPPRPTSWGETVMLVHEVPPCERCGTTEGVDVRSSRTMYPAPRLSSWERMLLDDEGLGEPPDPNAPPWLCPECAKEHDEYWDEMWSDYYRSCY